MLRAGLLTVAIAIVSFGCVTDDPFGIAPGGGGGTMSATIDGASWQAKVEGPGAVSVTASRRELNGTSHLTITGASTDGTTGKGVTIGLRSRAGFPLGMYTVRQSGGAETASAQLTLDQDDYEAISGKVVLEAIDDDSARGTFEFVADDDGDRVDVTSGKFDAEVRQL